MRVGIAFRPHDAVGVIVVFRAAWLVDRKLIGVDADSIAVRIGVGDDARVCSILSGEWLTPDDLAQVVTLLPQVAVDVEVRHERVKLLRFAPPPPGRAIGLAWRHTSPRKMDFVAPGQLVTATQGVSASPRRARASAS